MARDLIKSSNPAFRTAAYKNMQTGIGETMTLKGTINKTIVLFALLLITAAWTWSQYTAANPGIMMSDIGAFGRGTISPDIGVIMPYIWGGIIGGLILAIATIVKPNWAGFTAPLYAIAEGFAVGGISAYVNSYAHGVAIQAVALTFGVMLVMLALYRTGVIKVTHKFRMGMAAAVGGIVLFYIVTLIAQMFGADMSMLFGHTNLSIGISLVIIVIASLSLVLDFDMIHRASTAGAPKYMEWYGGFSLMVTLIWLYMEILRLLVNVRQ